MTAMFNIVLPPNPFDQAVAAIAESIRDREARMQELADQIAAGWSAKAEKLERILRPRGR